MGCIVWREHMPDAIRASRAWLWCIAVLYGHPLLANAFLVVVFGDRRIRRGVLNNVAAMTLGGDG
jgi:hypothetical protein